MSPILRCRWKETSPSKDPWIVQFSMEDDGIDEPPFPVPVRGLYRMSRGERGAGEEEGLWQELSQAPPPNWVLGAMRLEMTHFCDVIAVLRESEIDDIEEGYIKLKRPTRPHVQRVLNALPVFHFPPSGVRVYNCSRSRLGIVPLQPHREKMLKDWSAAINIVGNGVGIGRALEHLLPSRAGKAFTIRSWLGADDKEYDKAPRHLATNVKEVKYWHLVVYSVNDEENIACPRAIIEEGGADTETILLNTILDASPGYGYKSFETAMHSGTRCHR